MSNTGYPEEEGGGESLAFLRLGRSSGEDSNSDKVIRKEVDNTMKVGGLREHHNIIKRSNYIIENSKNNYYLFDYLWK